MNFWISALKGDQEFKIDAHEIEKTILNVPELDRKWLSSFSHLQGIELSHEKRKYVRLLLPSRKKTENFEERYREYVGLLPSTQKSENFEGRCRKYVGLLPSTQKSENFEGRCRKCVRLLLPATKEAAKTLMQ